MNAGIYEVNVGVYGRGGFDDIEIMRTEKVMARQVVEAIHKVKYQKGVEFISSVRLIDRLT